MVIRNTFSVKYKPFFSDARGLGGSKSWAFWNRRRRVFVDAPHRLGYHFSMERNPTRASGTGRAHLEKAASAQHGPIASAFTALTALTLLAAAAASSLARAELPKELEPEYAEAVLAFNGRDYDRALKLLNELLRQQPGATELLELKALTLKSSKKGEQSAELYQKLIDAKTAEGADEEDIAPYHFELGVIRFREKKYDEARKHLEFAVEEDFNDGAANFFLGIIHFQGGNWAAAEDHFSDVTSSSADDLVPPSHFYLGQTSLKTGYAPGGVRHLVYARDTANEILERSTSSADTKTVAAKIKAQAEKGLAPLDRSRKYANVAALTGYDSNVLAFPDDFSGEASGKTSPQVLLRGSAGWMSSPLDTYQLHPSIRSEFNYNLNPSAFQGMIVRTTPSFYVTRTPLARFSIGGKVETPVSFKGTTDGDSKTFGLFSSSIELGPFVRWEMFRRTFLTFEFFPGLTRYKGDKVVEPVLMRSGPTMKLRLGIQRDTGSRFFNPAFSISHFERGLHEEQEGEPWQPREFAARGDSISFSNLMYLGNDRIALSISREDTSYDRREGPQRSDVTALIGATYTRKWSQKITLLGQVAWTRNWVRPAEDRASYAFRRFLVSAGASYALW